MRKLLLWLVGAALVLQTAVEYLALPALLAVIGILNGFGWNYYIWTIGGYTVIVILIKMIGGFIGKRLGSRIASRLKKARGSADSTDSDNVC